ncbi:MULTISPECIES: hypothetical protein [Streptomyces]|uniref:Integral membrane protein n=1 Tax=Streptomyces spinosisporus TaxID=2927582 RepID=A0ABS9XD63_9ACTN|nr:MULTISPECIES: hypothetical protein [Streptomyces]MCI3238842.1 hypothetical protein [Streptomyces spinosisporus]WUB34778.1 hypothetical protein OHN38_07605 [Streptomyces sp. NBC_00588]
MGHRTHRYRNGHEADRSGRGSGAPGLRQNRLVDRRWAPDLRTALLATGSFLGLLLLTDAAAGTFTAQRAGLWSGLALLLFHTLMPDRVAADEGWLAVRTLLATHRVRTDRLVEVRATGHAGQRLVLRDAFGGRVEFDTQVLVDNPDLWHRLDTDARTSPAAGHTVSCRASLSALAQRIDRETARAVFHVSGLTEEPKDPCDS